MPDFLPQSEPRLLQWSTNFAERIESDAVRYGLSPETAAEYRALHDDFAAAFRRASDPATRSPLAILVRRDAKARLLTLARKIAREVKGKNASNGPLLSELGLRTRKRAVKTIAPPDTAPLVILRPFDGHKQDLDRPAGALSMKKPRTNEATGVTVRLLDTSSPTRLARPRNATGATIFTYVGEAAPSSRGQWKFYGNTSRRSFNIDAGPAIPPGSRLWVTARWIGTRSQPGPASRPVGMRIAGN